MGNATTVLIIDDSLSACQFMTLALEKVGYRVIYAPDGHEGIRKAFQERPHCVILDVILPGIGGFEVCRRLRASDPDHRLPVIMVSTKNTPVDQSLGPAPGSRPVLTEAIHGRGACTSGWGRVA